MSEKKISVIIPCYNVEKYIDRCFRSLVYQTLGMDKLEIIFVNDASTDATIDHLRRFEAQYPDDVLLIDLQVNGGQGAARNIGIQYASCDFIGFVDGDDMIEPDMYEKMLSIAIEKQCDIAECTWNFFSEQSRTYTDPQLNKSCIGWIDFTNETEKCDYIVENLFFTSVCTRLFDRHFLLNNQIEFPQGLKYEDCYFIV